MPDFDLVLRAGEVVTATGRRHADLGILEGRVAAIGPDLGPGAKEMDVRGRLVLPGGIDSHCHVAQVNSSGVRTADDFRSATLTAAAGGITTIIPFAVQRRGESAIDAVAAYHGLAEGQAVIDYGFHVILTDAHEHLLDEFPELISAGITSFKIFMTYDRVRLDERGIIAVMDRARVEDATVMVHAESHDLLQWLTERLIAQGKTSPKYMPEAHPIALERDAAHRVITMAEVVGGRIVLVHVSGRETVAQLEWARARGIPILAETCPQYLVLTGDKLDQPDFHGAKYCCSPPPRDGASQAALWRGLVSGVLQIYSSDHSVFRFEGPDGKRANGIDAPFNHIPMGLPGLETSLPILFSEGVMKGRIAIDRFAALTSENAARVYGLFPRKGTLEVGSDADVTIWNPDGRRRIAVEDLKGVSDYSPYEGMEILGRLETTIARGEVVYDGGNIVGTPGRGRFVRCGRGSSL